ncbi:MAG: hypothetical protein AABZ06_04600 [Bdellovibrionota bacterium]
MALPNLAINILMAAYRQKYLIENAFLEMKSILKLRPWFVYKTEHVRAHCRALSKIPSPVQAILKKLKLGAALQIPT